jgi:hypothetical protein
MCQQRRHNQSIQPYFSALLVLSFVANIVLVAFVSISCFEEKSIWTNLTRQGFIPFHVSHQVSVRTNVHRNMDMYIAVTPKTKEEMAGEIAKRHSGGQAEF